MSSFTLKNILVIDGVTCAGIFLIALLIAVPVASLLGLPVSVVTAAGWICLASSFLMFGTAAQKTPNIALAQLIALGNVAWVVASFGVIAIFSARMTELGMVFVGVQAIAVLGFAFIEWKKAMVL